MRFKELHYAVAVRMLAFDPACRRESNHSANGHLQELQPWQNAQLDMYISGCFAQRRTQHVFWRNARGQMLVKDGTAPGIGGRTVSEADVVAIDRELAQLKNQKNHFCTTSVLVDLVTPAGAGNRDKSQFSDGSYSGLATLHRVLH